LGKVYQSQRKFTDAERILRIAVHSEPQDITALYHLAQVLQTLGLTEEAKADFERVRQMQEQSHRQPLEALQATEAGMKAMDEGRVR